ncbi:MAG TPA: flagellar hook protein FlgE [Acidimicrobiales bacterium]|jgi:flagellar hook protein FlgE|nr:flagellar hook protein FlgE [Acidimicrobiales bacterium]
MEQSLIAAVSGIESNQTYMNVIGNNVANANTVGYKSENADFTDLLAQQIAGASAPQGSGQGAGINPISIGSGVRIGAVNDDQGQGSLIQTNQPTDVAIQGDGYLVAKQNGQTLYTRAGNLTLDANGDLATQTGGLVQGWMANAQGAMNTNAPTGPVSIPTGQTMPASATTVLNVGGNLPAWSGIGTPNPVTATINTYDQLGDAIPVTLTYTPVSGTANSWTVQGVATSPDGTKTNLWNTAPTITFNPASGQISSISGATTNSDGSMTLTVNNMPAGVSFPSGDTWSIGYAAPSSTNAVTQFSGQQTMTITNQDGYSSGTLSGFSIGGDGVITGSFSNGKTLAIGEIALATFSNPGGLSDAGNQMYAYTPNSGQPNIGTPNTGGRGSLVGGSLESSNVDLATQLTDLIVAQEAYQANTKVVSTTANNLQALTQMA